ncbi:MAG: Shikimate dehydrogenase [Methanosaeta sp. PtaB.Bin039]|nr:MAG: Shikimate dehydrogenase [Methanosaeta sp. PtaB.Bin039]HOT07289.1 shikimate dehydrogenase [Methanotrichaceae archaeon]HQF15814.1 shikimate dehydrogenase [Methanotrichaceae archaeon]HQI90510.1 shikimate dehydrogenase [Methanotrichaceae archaeon]HQJ28101.1 shikimate dehydrogenase [Methanotrichaceae archaeon]
MKVYAVFGDPVDHSLSPVMHNAAFRSMGIEACYHPFRVGADALADALSGAKAMGFGGINLTIPLKEKALSLVQPDETARAIGAVNTVAFGEGIMTGHNTDGSGALLALERAGIWVPKSRVLLIGAGGAARALAYELSLAKVELAIANRHPARAVAMAETFSASGHGFDEIRELVEWADLIVNATSVGMHQGEKRLFDGRLLKRDQAVFDIVYNRETELIRDARQAGARAVDGVTMLVHQGALALRIWTGLEPPVRVMEAAVREALQSRQAPANHAESHPARRDGTKRAGGKGS